MLRSIILLVSLFVCSCGIDGTDGSPGDPGNDGLAGKDGKDGEKGEKGNTGASGKDGINGKDGANGKDYVAPEKKVISGYWYLPNGGYIEFLEDSEGRIIINGTQRIYSANTDSTLGLYLPIAVGPHRVSNGSFRIEATYTYVALTHNIHSGSTTTPIVGSRKTVTTFSLNSSKKLVINMKVYTASGLAIDSDKTITSE